MRNYLDDAALRPQPRRDGPDDWTTPADLVDVAIQHVLPLLPAGPIWEMAPGSGALVDAFIAAGRAVVTTRGNFMTQAPPPGARIAMSNPPFNRIDEFIKRGFVLLDSGQLDAVTWLWRCGSHPNSAAHAMGQSRLRRARLSATPALDTRHQDITALDVRMDRLAGGLPRTAEPAGTGPAGMDTVMGWTCSCQDWRSHAPGSGTKPPKPIKKWFATREEALAHRQYQRELNPGDSFVTCVSPAAFRQGKLEENPEAGTARSDGLRHDRDHEHSPSMVAR